MSGPVARSGAHRARPPAAPARSAPPTPATPPTPPTPSASDTATDVVRWAAFSCFLVPVILLWYGTSLAGAAGTAFGLAAVTAACRVLLRRSERGATRCATQRGGRHTRGGTPVS
ncbi:hypothetical protein ACQEV4_40945 [Streptomyces shenzhenensis]|uniref:hypothetical protein n=1 Tax=Streptomyces shenzhenensis TaxID=943815 RepID=UPI003D8F7956